MDGLSSGLLATRKTFEYDVAKGFNMEDLKYLKLLSKKYKNRKEASAEIINLRAILALPKGTEYYLSDLHGEYEAFKHMILSASGVIKIKINELFKDELSGKERYRLASLIYNPVAEMKRIKLNPGIDFRLWCKMNITRMIYVCKAVSTKYTRSKVRKKLPKDWAYSMDELLHADDEENKGAYYDAIIDSIIETGMAESYIKELAGAITILCVDRLHIIGDIFDRGSHPDLIMDYLIKFDDVDFQWGNHDIVWMGAAAGSWACTANLLRMNISYNNFDMLEIGYGINLRPLTSFANRVYRNDPCEGFMPKVLEKNQYDQVSKETAAKMHKAIAIMQFKIEGQRILANPQYNLNHRLLLDKIDFEKGTVRVKGVDYPMKDMNLPTVNPKNPYELTKEELRVMRNLQASVMRSRKLQEHITHLYTHGAFYKVMNNKLMFHGCIPLAEDGSFRKVTIEGETHSGKALFDYLDTKCRECYFSPNEDLPEGSNGDLMWYLWLSKDSPLFGKDQMTTFERLFIADKKTHKEITAGYYKMRDNKEFCEGVLREFGLDPKKSHILNGHVPVKIKDGESPIKGGGKLFVIDGGISKAYQKTTGIAGYTFIYNSWLMGLAEHKPYEPLQKDGSQKFFAPRVFSVETLKERILVRDTDQAPELNKQIDELKDLIEAYRKGLIKEIY